MTANVLSHRAIANNLQFGFIFGRQESAPEAYEDFSYCLRYRMGLSWKTHEISATAKQRHRILLRTNVTPKISMVQIPKGY